MLCVQESTGEKPNTFLIQTYLKINVRVLITELSWRYWPGILEICLAQEVAKWTEQRQRLPLRGASLVWPPLRKCLWTSIYSSFSPKEMSFCPWCSHRAERCNLHSDMRVSGWASHPWLPLESTEGKCCDLSGPKAGRLRMSWSAQ